MAIPEIIRRSDGPNRPVIEITEGDSFGRHVVFVDSLDAPLHLGSTTTAEFVVYYGSPGNYTVAATGTATIDGNGSTGMITLALTADETADIGAAIVWRPLQAIDEKTMMWRLTLSDGTNTVTTHKAAVRVNRREV